MKIQKIIAAIMILTSSILTALVSRDIAYPALLCVLGLLGLQRRFTWDIKPERRVIKSFLLLFLAIMFALQFRHGGSGRFAFEQAAAVAWQTISRYFLASMILVLFLGSPRQLPASLGLFHVAITISAGQVLLLDDRYVAFRLSELFSVLLVVFYAAASDRGQARPGDLVNRPSSFHPSHSRWFAFALVLLVAVNCGWVMSSMLYRHVEVLNYLPVWFWRGGAGSGGGSEGVSLLGFSNSGKLSSILFMKGEQDPTPVLTIKSDSSPGYVRANVFDVYRDRESEWLCYAPKQEIFPQQSGPFGIYFAGRRNIFRLDSRDTDDCQTMAIQHESRFVDAVFTPLGTLFLEAPFPVIFRDENDIVHASSLRSGLNYRIGYRISDYRKRPDSLQENRMLGTPRDLDQRILELAEKIFVGCNTTTEKIEAVVRYFNTNYTYALGLDIPPDQDKLTFFLTEASTGYCEYFASGAAILLRLAGVPTRYVTGFLVTEQDPERQVWVARNMDAHAWVEAWDQQLNQWTTVEATVGEDAGSTAAAGTTGGLGGGTRALLNQLLRALYEYGLLGALSWLFESYGMVAGLLLSTPLFGVALALTLLRRRKGRRCETSSRLVRNPALVSLHRILARMDRKVAAAGLRRGLSETLHAFSQRLGAQDSGDGLWGRISSWYLEYANLRYRGPLDSESVHDLQQRAQRLHESS